MGDSPQGHFPGINPDTLAAHHNHRHPFCLGLSLWALALPEWAGQTTGLRGWKGPAEHCTQAPSPSKGKHGASLMLDTPDSLCPHSLGRAAPIIPQWGRLYPIPMALHPDQLPGPKLLPSGHAGSQSYVLWPGRWLIKLELVTDVSKLLNTQKNPGFQLPSEVKNLATQKLYLDAQQHGHNTPPPQHGMCSLAPPLQVDTSRNALPTGPSTSNLRPVVAMGGSCRIF